MDAFSDTFSPAFSNGAACDLERDLIEEQLLYYELATKSSALAATDCHRKQTASHTQPANAAVGFDPAAAAAPAVGSCQPACCAIAVPDNGLHAAPPSLMVPVLSSPTGGLGPLLGPSITSLSPHHLAQLQQMFNPSLFMAAHIPPPTAAPPAVPTAPPGLALQPTGLPVSPMGGLPTSLPMFPTAGAGAAAATTTLAPLTSPTAAHMLPAPQQLMQQQPPYQGGAGQPLLSGCPTQPATFSPPASTFPAPHTRAPLKEKQRGDSKAQPGKRAGSGAATARAAPSCTAAGCTPSQQGPKAGAGASAVPLTVPADDLAETVTDWHKLSTMQKYHMRRKLNLQRMEQALADKLAQLQLLEAENLALKQRALVLETMVSDVDKQLELMSVSDTNNTGQWLALLTAGGAKLPGALSSTSSSPRQQQHMRPLHVLFELVADQDVPSWTVEVLKNRWREYVAQLRPLLQQVDAARMAYLRGQLLGQQQGQGMMTSSCNGSCLGQQQQPRRAGVVAKVEGGGCSSGSTGPAVFGAGQLPSLCGGPQQCSAGSPQTSDNSEHHSVCSKDCSNHEPLGVVDGRVVYGGPGTEGVPLPLLAQVEALVMANYTWLVAMMTRSNLLTYEFLSADFQDQGRLAPAAGDAFWADVAQAMELSQGQMLEASLCHQMGSQCRQQVREERQKLQQVLEQHPEGTSVSLLPEMARMDGQLAALESMQRNVRREAILRNMVGLHSINLFTLLQHARMAVAAFPWFCSAWSLYAAVDVLLHNQQHHKAGGGAGGCSRGGSGSSSSGR